MSVAGSMADRSAPVLVATAIPIPQGPRLAAAAVLVDGTVTLIDRVSLGRPVAADAALGRLLTAAAVLERVGLTGLDQAWRQATGTGLVSAIRLTTQNCDHAADTADDLSAAVSSGLSAGRLLLVLAGPEAPAALGETVRFINQRTAPSGLRLITTDRDTPPIRDLTEWVRLVGEIQPPRRDGRSAWCVSDLIRAVAAAGTPTTATAVRHLLRHADERHGYGRLQWGTGGVPSAAAVYATGSGECSCWGIDTSSMGPGADLLVVHFDAMRRHGGRLSAGRIGRFADTIGRLPGLGTPVTLARAKDWRLRVTVPLNVPFASEGAAATFLDALDALLGTPRRSAAWKQPADAAYRADT